MPKYQTIEMLRKDAKFDNKAHATVNLFQPAKIQDGTEPIEH